MLLHLRCSDLCSKASRSYGCQCFHEAQSREFAAIIRHKHKPRHQHYTVSYTFLNAWIGGLSVERKYKTARKQELCDYKESGHTTVALIAYIKA
jgi:hypothetical protein